MKIDETRALKKNLFQLIILTREDDKNLLKHTMRCNDTKYSERKLSSLFFLYLSFKYRYEKLMNVKEVRNIIIVLY